LGSVFGGFLECEFLDFLMMIFGGGFFGVILGVDFGFLVFFSDFFGRCDDWWRWNMIFDFRGRIFCFLTSVFLIFCFRLRRNFCPLFFVPPEAEIRIF
jgi:hypothetical protein